MESPVNDSSVLSDRPAAVESVTLGQMLDAALGAPKTDSIDFEQLRNLLNGLLLHLGLKDLAVQETGEPLEGAERSPFSASFLEELMRKVEANEKEMAEMRTLCRELREEVDEVKAEQSLMAEDMQRMQEILDPENFQNMLDDLRDQVLENVMSTMAGEETQEPSPEVQKESTVIRTRPWDDQGLIVIGNEITLLERPKTPTPRYGGSRPITPQPHKAKEKDLPEANANGQPTSVGANDTGQNVGRKGWNMGQKGVGWNMGRSDGEQRGVGWRMGRRDVGRNVRQGGTGRHDTGQDDMGQDDMGQDDMGQIKDKEIKTRIPKAETLPSHLDVPSEMTDVGEIKDGEIKEEEITVSISETEALPSPLDVPPETTDVGEIKEGEIKDGEIKDEEIKEEEITISISKKTSLDGSFTTSGTHPGAPGAQFPVQRVQSVRGHPGSKTLWIPSESVPGSSSGSRLQTPKEGRGRGSSRREAFPADAGLKLLKVPSAEYSPCDSVLQTPGRYPQVTPPVSPGLSGHLHHGVKHVQVEEDREQAAERYSRRSPMYCGGQHTSTCPVQPMEPLLPDPNKPGAFDLVGKDGLVYRGRTPAGMD